MGNACCCSSNELKEGQIENLVKIQAAFRGYQAKKQLSSRREKKIDSLFQHSASSSRLHSANKAGGFRSAQKGRESSVEKSRKNCSISQSKTLWQTMNNPEEAGQKVPAAYMTDSDINSIFDKNYQDERIGPFTLEPHEIRPDDSVDRLFIDTFVEMSDNKKYKGQVKKGTLEKDGIGVQFWKDGSKYEGMWRRGKANGRGRMTHSNGDIYEGFWVNDLAQGFGIFMDTQGSRYEGNWEKDLQHGYGMEIWESGAATYQGQFFKGKKCGCGRFDWEDGSYYEGNFVDGHFEGQGTYYFADVQKTYSGEFRMSTIEGKGVENWPDGRRYEGEFKQGKKDGQGCFTWANQNKYIGSWVAGKQHGIGIFYCHEDGTKKQGTWNLGKRQSWLNNQKQEAEQLSPSKKKKQKL